MSAEDAVDVTPRPDGWRVIVIRDLDGESYYQETGISDIVGGVIGPEVWHLAVDATVERLAKYMEDPK